MVSERDHVLAVLGRKAVLDVMEATGRNNMTMAGWQSWRRLLGVKLVTEDFDAAGFTDGWPLRHFQAEKPREGGCKHSRLPGQIPHTEADEKIAWGFSEEMGDVYPVPY